MIGTLLAENTPVAQFHVRELFNPGLDFANLSRDGDRLIPVPQKSILGNGDELLALRRRRRGPNATRVRKQWPDPQGGYRIPETGVAVRGPRQQPFCPSSPAKHQNFVRVGYIDEWHVVKVICDKPGKMRGCPFAPASRLRT